MACSIEKRNKAIQATTQRLLKSIKEANPGMPGAEIRAKAKEAATKIVDKAQAVVEGETDTLNADPANPTDDKTGKLYVPADKINNTDSLLEVLDNLEVIDEVEISDSHKAHLQTVIKHITKGLKKPIEKMNVYLEEVDEGNNGFVEFKDGKGVYLKQGKNPGSFKTNMTLSEIFVHELIHGASHYGLNKNSVELSKQIRLLTQLRSKVLAELTPEDLVGGAALTDVEYAIAEERLNYMAGKNGLEEFLAMALSNEHIFNKLNKIRIKDDTKNMKLGGKLFNAFLDFIDAMLKYMGKETARSMKGDALVMKLVSDIGALNHKAERIRKDTLFAKTNRTIDKYEEKWKDFLEGNEAKMHDAIQAKMAKGEKLNLLDKVKAFHYVLASEDGSPVLQQFLAMLGQREEGTLQTIVKHVKHADKYGNLWQKLILASTHIDSIRENTASNIAKVMNAAFGKNKLRIQQKKALYGATMMADSSTLINTYNKQELRKVYANEDVLNKKIQDIESELKEELEQGDYNYLLDQSKGLADLMMNGNSTIVQRKNANAIADHVLGSKQASDAMVAKIDLLTSLYATQMMSKEARKSMADLVDNHYDGVKLVADAQKGFRDYVVKKYPEEAHNLMKNYHRETFDTEGAIEIAQVDAATRNKMALEGYEYVEDVDALGLGYGDDVQLGLYLSPERTKRPMNRASMRYTGDREPGMSLWQDSFKRGFDNSVHDIVSKRIENAKSIAVDYELAVRAGKTPPAETNVVPVVDSNNKVVDYKTQVKTETKIKYMGLDADTAQAVGRSQSHEADLEESRELNAVVWDSLVEDMAENAHSTGDIGKNGHRYVDISALSDVAEVRDAASILPKEIRDNMNLLKRVNVAIKNANVDSQEGASDETAFEGIPKNIRKYVAFNDVNGKFELSTDMVSELVGEDRVKKMSKVQLDKMKKIFAKNTFKVRRDMLLDVFGVRDASLANLLPDHQMTKHLKKAIRLIENAWKEIVKIFKVDVIIRTLPVIMGNMVSNIMYSFQYGLSPMAVAKRQLEGVKLLKLYLKEEAELQELIGKMAADPGNKRLALRKAELESSMAASPLKPLMEAGLYQHIIEDVNMQEFRSNSKISRFIDEKTENVPEWIKTGGNWLFINEKTSLFQAVTTMTAYSDFVARYAQYTLGSEKEKKIFQEKHGREMTPKEEAKLKEDTVIRVRDAYVNYSKPDGKVLQYMNDMGFVAFSKYAIRIQAGIADLIRFKPMRFALALAGQELMEWGTGYNPDDIGEVSILSRAPTSWVYTPGVEKILGDIIEPQMITHINAALS